MKDLIKRLKLKTTRKIPRDFMSEEQFSELFNAAVDVKSYSKRVQTFLDNDWESDVSIDELAKAGFCCYKSEKRNQVVCFSCRGTIANWEEADIPLKIHRKGYPECKHAMDKANLKNICKKCTTFDNPRKEAENNLEDEIDDMHFFYSEFNRLMSFKYWPLSSFVDRYDLASAGFYCIDETKTVICVGCFAEVSDWSLGDRTQSKHIKLEDGNPCPFGAKQNEETAIGKVEIQQFIRSECAAALKRT